MKKLLKIVKTSQSAVKLINDPTILRITGLIEDKTSDEMK